MPAGASDAPLPPFQVKALDELAKQFQSAAADKPAIIAQAGALGLNDETAK